MSDPSADPHRHALDAIRRELDRLGDGGRRIVPAWKRVTPGEHRWPAAAAIVVAIGLQLLLPDQLTLVSRWLLPSLSWWCWSCSRWPARPGWTASRRCCAASGWPWSGC